LSAPLAGVQIGSRCSRARCLPCVTRTSPPSSAHSGGRCSECSARAPPPSPASNSTTRGWRAAAEHGRRRSDWRRRRRAAGR